MTPEHPKHAAKTPTPISNSLCDSELEISAELKPFAVDNPAEMLGNYFPPEVVERFAGMVFGLGFDSGVSVPEFAKQASRQFWKYFFSRGFNPLASTKDIGIFSKLLDLAGQSPSPRKKTAFEIAALKALPKMLELFQKEVAKLSDEEKAKYYAGRVEAKAVMKKFHPQYLKMVKRAPMYLAIAAHWRILQSFSSLAQAERWLRDNKVIGKNVNSTEVRAVFRLVGLRYRGPGRPKKPENALSPSSEIRI